MAENYLLTLVENIDKHFEEKTTMMNKRNLLVCLELVVYTLTQLPVAALPFPG